MQPWMKSVHEAAEEGIDDNDTGTEEQGMEVIHAEDRLKELATGDKSR